MHIALISIDHTGALLRKFVHTATGIFANHLYEVGAHKSVRIYDEIIL